MQSDITVWLDAIGNIGITESREKQSRLEWQAPGFDIYKRGRFSITQYEAATNIVLNYLIERHVPAIAMRRVAK